MADLAPGVERPGQRDVLDHGDLVGLGELADPGGDHAGALGDDPRGALGGVVAQRDGDVGGVHQHHVGQGYVGHHPVARGGELARADLPLHHRVTLALLVLVAHLLLGHPDLLAGAPALHGVVRAGRDQAGERDVAHQPGGRRAGDLHRHRQRDEPADQRHQPEDRAPDEEPDQRALEQHLRALPEGVRAEDPLDALERVEPRPLGLHRLGGEEQAALGDRGGHPDHHHAGAHRQGQHQREPAAVPEQLEHVVRVRARRSSAGCWSAGPGPCPSRSRSSSGWTARPPGSRPRRRAPGCGRPGPPCGCP